MQSLQLLMKEYRRRGYPLKGKTLEQVLDMCESMLKEDRSQDGSDNLGRPPKYEVSKVEGQNKYYIYDGTQSQWLPDTTKAWK
eukprot:7844403-Karenia_brevis.AAC.1